FFRVDPIGRGNAGQELHVGRIFGGFTIDIYLSVNDLQAVAGQPDVAFDVVVFFVNGPHDQFRLSAFDLTGTVGADGPPAVVINAPSPFGENIHTVAFWVIEHHRVVALDFINSRQAGERDVRAGQIALPINAGDAVVQQWEHEHGFRGAD